MSRLTLLAAGFLASALLCSDAAHAASLIKSCGTEITERGSYRVARNLTVAPGGGHCITLKSGFVSLDLGGFTIDCAGEPVDGLTDLTVNFRGVIVRNGRITGCARGIYMGSRAVLVDGVSTFDNHAGIFLGNSGNLVTRSVSNDNYGAPVGIVRDGLYLTCPSAAIENTATGNTHANIKTDQAGCVLYGNLAP